MGGIKYVPKKRSPKAAAPKIRLQVRRKPTTPSQAARNRIAAEKFRLRLLNDEIKLFEQMAIRKRLSNPREKSMRAVAAMHGIKLSKSRSKSSSKSRGKTSGKRKSK